MVEVPPVATEPSAPRSGGARSGGARARKRAETRERLFVAALKEFREYGFAAAQIDRIARAAGVVRGTFYFHFPSKDDVLLELARRINARIALRVERIGETEQSLSEYLRRLNNAIMDEHTRIGEAGLLAELLSLYVRRPRDLQHPPDQGSSSLAGVVARHLDELEESGAIQSSMCHDLAAIVFLTSVFGIYVRIPPGEALREACEALIELFVAGMKGK